MNGKKPANAGQTKRHTKNNPKTSLYLVGMPYFKSGKYTLAFAVCYLKQQLLFYMQE